MKKPEANQSIFKFLLTHYVTRVTCCFDPDLIAQFPECQVRVAKSQGIIRYRLVGKTPCRDPYCIERGWMKPTRSQDREGFVHLRCSCGATKYVIEDHMTAVELNPNRLFSYIARSNDLTNLFEEYSGSSGKVLPCFNNGWLSGSTICFLRSTVPKTIAADLAATILLGSGQYLFLLDDTQQVPRASLEILARHNIFVASLEGLFDWELLELDRAAVFNSLQGIETIPKPTADESNLLLNLRTCQAIYRGVELKLSPLRFGFLAALATTPGETVHRDQITEYAYGVLNANRAPYDKALPDVSHVAKLKSDVVKELRRAITDTGGEDSEVRDIVVPQHGVGYRLNESVTIAS